MKSIKSYQLENIDQYAKYMIESETFEAAMVTSKGGKSENQDACSISTAIDGTEVFCVADGLGGHAGGRVASQVAIEAVCKFIQKETFQFENPQTMLDAFKVANDSIIARQKTDIELLEMRSTLIIVFIKDSLAFWGHVGDVRLYHIRKQKVFFQTKDHSVPQMLVDTGDITQEEIRNHPDRSRLLNSLGDAEKKLKVTIPQRYQQIEVDDYLHLSTDGFWEWLVESKMISILSESQTVLKATISMAEEVVSNAEKVEDDYDNLTGLTIKILSALTNQRYRHKTFYKAL